MGFWAWFTIGVLSYLLVAFVFGARIGAEHYAKNNREFSFDEEEGCDAFFGGLAWPLVSLYFIWMKLLRAFGEELMDND